VYYLGSGTEALYEVWEELGFMTFDVFFAIIAAVWVLVMALGSLILGHGEKTKR
jgi:hypothetical protein